jgi:hypothetical protein
MQSSASRAARSAKVLPRREGIIDQARSSPTHVTTKPATMRFFISDKCRLM